MFMCICFSFDDGVITGHQVCNTSHMDRTAELCLTQRQCVKFESTLDLNESGQN